MMLERRHAFECQAVRRARCAKPQRIAINDQTAMGRSAELTQAFHDLTGEGSWKAPFS
jgi:hypothetical protein